MLTAHHHGGFCCGMTTIQGFPWAGPNDLLPTDHNTKETWAKMKGWERTRALQAPGETAGQRLRRQISSIEIERPNGIIEVVLTHKQKPQWETFLAELGFKIVNQCSNSNSLNTIIVWHRNSGEVPVADVSDLASYIPPKTEATPVPTPYEPVYVVEGDTDPFVNEFLVFGD